MKSKNKYFNPNPLKKENGDCVVRAICAISGESWDNVYKDLCSIGFELKAMPNDKETWKSYLIQNGYVRYSISNKKGSKRPTVNEMAVKSKKEGAFLCETAHHLVTVKDGAILDIWDCGEKSLYGYWCK
jgi:hypothetical protein